MYQEFATSLQPLLQYNFQQFVTYFHCSLLFFVAYTISLLHLDINSSPLPIDGAATSTNADFEISNLKQWFFFC